MKKLVVALVMAVLLLAGFVFAGGVKTLKVEGIEPAVVPELAPEFYNWNGQVLGGMELAPGKEIVVLQTVNPDQTCMVMSLFFKADGKIHLVGLAAHYLDGSRDIYEDDGFKKNGVPTGVLTLQKEAMTMEDLKRIFPEKVGI